MPGNTKNEQKNKNEPKDQRRKRQVRNPPGPVGKKEDEKPIAAVNPQDKSAQPYIEPPPEFYKNLKRETEDILKITEEANSKYKKKEIQSNWAKYEMPIESYEDIDEQESIGADFESLIQASLSVGGHFQFKHEKSWDVSSDPTLYDKYFDINMDNLNIALSSIPFYERNNIDTSLFTETDMQTMNHRAIKYKNKYFNDTRYTTPEIEAENKLLSSLMKKEEIESKEDAGNSTTFIISDYIDNKDIEEFMIEPEKQKSAVTDEVKISESKEKVENVMIDKAEVKNLFEDALKVKEISVADQKVVLEAPLQQETHGKENASVLEKEKKNPAIDSPEDLEKWLDDFLDG